MLKKKLNGVSSWMGIGLTVLGLIAIVCYSFANKEESYTNALAFLFLGTASALSLVSIFFDFKGLIGILCPAFFALGLTYGLFSGIVKFGLAFNGVAEGEGGMGAPNAFYWIFAVVCLLAGLLGIVRSFLPKKEPTA